MSRPKFSRQLTPIDAIAACIAFAALGGLIWTPKLSNSIAKATGALRPVHVSVDVRNVPVADPTKLIDEAMQHGRASIVIRNQPAGSVELDTIEDMRRFLVAVQPDGSVVKAVDPNPISQSVLDARFILKGDAAVSKTGVVIAGTNLKIGTPVEIEGSTYRVNGIVSGVRIK
ncbi:MAG: DUF4330 domain-containing protein [Prochlorococcus sp.]|nr:MAG: Uncharacterised protein [Prochlorococcus marinus str. MIT 9215]